MVLNVFILIFTRDRDINGKQVLINNSVTNKEICSLKVNFKTSEFTWV